MMKWLGVVTALLLTLSIALYVLLFTPLGNGIVAPLVESKINKTLAIESKLRHFMLDSSSFAMDLELAPGNKIEVAGNYALFTQKFNAVYRIRFNQLASLQPLSKIPLEGEFHTEGTIQGDLAVMEIAGKSDLAKSQTRYAMVLNDFAPGNMKLSMKQAQVEQLLHLLGKKPYTTAQLNMELDFKSIDPKRLDGDATITLLDGRINQKVMQEAFNLKLPKTTYAMKTIAQLQGDSVTYTSKFESNLAYLFSQGRVKPEPLAADLKYEVDIKELALFKPITNAPLRGPFSTTGSVTGTQESMKVQGKSDIAGSQSSYDVDLHAFKPKKVIATIKDAALSKLLYLAGQPTYADGKINADIILTDLDPKNLSGGATIKLSRGTINQAVMKKEYGITLPETAFTYELDTKLSGKSVDYTTYFNSDLAEIDSTGKLHPEEMGVDLDYRVAIEQLELLKPFTGMTLQGPLSLNGTLKGDRKLMKLKGQSDIAKSDTSYRIELSELKPKSISASVKRLQLASLLHLVAQPSYANALVDIDIEIPNAQEGKLDGEIVTLIGRGTLNNPVLEKSYQFKKMPRVTFRGKTTSTLRGSSIETKGELLSSLADFTLKRAETELKNGVTTAEYQAKIHNLDHLYFATERHLKGSMLIDGDLKKGKDLDLRLRTDTLGGNIEALLHNDELQADLKSIQTLDALQMLIYPEIFRSTLNGVLKYNLKSKKGTFDATLADGRFTPNIMLDLVRQYGRMDLYKEQFTGTLASHINKEQILSDMELKSNRSSITTKEAKLNSKTKMIDAKVDINANNNPLGVTIRGNTADPDVRIDAGRIIEKEATKQLDKLFKKLF